MMKKTENRVRLQFKLSYDDVNINQRASFLPDDKKIYSSKCNRKSMQFKEEGNTFYSNKDLKMAQIRYSQSIIEAEHNSECYGMALANRSAAYFENAMYHECVLDINDCLNSAYPEERRTKLLQRFQKCEERIKNGQQQKVPLAVPLPFHLFKKNLHIIGASAKVELAYSALAGRHIVASEDIEAGQILFLEPAFAFAQIFESENLFKDDSKCSNCLERISRIVPCKTCTTCLYCSSKCRDDSWNESHRWECPGMKYAFWYKIGLGFTAFRALVKGIPSKFETLTDITDTHKAFGDGYKYFASLESHLDDINDETLKNICDISAQIVRYLELKTDFFAHLMETGLEEDVACADYVGFLLVKHLAQLSCNASIIEHSHPVIKHIDSILDTCPVASGIYPTVSLMNHSCKSNITIYFMDKYIVVKALDESIRKGQQIYNSYGIDYRFSDKQERQEHLKELYYFDCNCMICCDDSKEFTNMDSVYCLKCYEPVYSGVCNKDSTPKFCRNCNAPIGNLPRCIEAYVLAKPPPNVAWTHEINLTNFGELFRNELETGRLVKAFDYLSAYYRCLESRVGLYHIDYGIDLFKKIQLVMEHIEQTEGFTDTFDKYMEIHSRLQTYLEDLRFIFRLHYPYYKHIEPLDVISDKFGRL